MLQKNGFTLLEVLIALFILAFGLLTLLELQTAVFRRSHDSYLQSLAVTEAANIADCIHSSLVESCVTDFNQKIAMLLPDGSATCKKNTDSYKISVCWTAHVMFANKNCVDLNAAL